jgi:hypothetical protein
MENFRIGTNFEIEINLFKFKKNSEDRRKEKENKIKAILAGPAHEAELCVRDRIPPAMSGS